MLARSACADAALARLVLWVMSDSLCVSVFAVFFVLYVYLMSSDCRYVCECSTHQIAQLGSLCTHTADYVYGSPRCFARFISSCMIRGAPIYPGSPVLLPTSCDRVGHATSRLLLLLDCSTCTGCIPCRWASTQLHDILLTRKHLTKSFAQALPCLFRL
jgi:hypothetical protein